MFHKAVSYNKAFNDLINIFRLPGVHDLIHRCYCIGVFDEFSAIAISNT